MGSRWMRWGGWIGSLVVTAGVAWTWGHSAGIVQAYREVAARSGSNNSRIVTSFTLPDWPDAEASCVNCKSSTWSSNSAPAETAPSASSEPSILSRAEPMCSAEAPVALQPAPLIPLMSGSIEFADPDCAPVGPAESGIELPLPLAPDEQPVSSLHVGSPPTDGLESLATTDAASAAAEIIPVNDSVPVVDTMCPVSLPATPKADGEVLANTDTAAADTLLVDAASDESNAPKAVSADFVSEVAVSSRPESPQPDPPSPKNADHRAVADSDSVRDIIDRELSDATAEERDIWFEELRQLPPAVVEDLLRVRRGVPRLPQLGRLPGAGLRPNRLPMPVDELSPTDPSSNTATAPIVDPELADMARQITEISRANLGAAMIPGYRQVVPLLTAAKDDDSSQMTRPKWLRNRLSLQQGELRQTSRSLDVAIDGPGWLCVTTPAGPAYSRFGGLEIDDQQRLCLPTVEGLRPLSPEVVLPEEALSVQIHWDGTVRVLAEAPEALKPSEPVGTIRLHGFRDDTALQLGVDGLYRPTAAAGPVRTLATMGTTDNRAVLQVGVLERSNVDREKELQFQRDLADWLAELPAATVTPSSVTSRTTSLPATLSEDCELTEPVRP
jgi:flagellar basal body rod protein FlgF